MSLLSICVYAKIETTLCSHNCNMILNWQFKMSLMAYHFFLKFYNNEEDKNGKLKSTKIKDYQLSEHWFVTFWRK